MNARGVAVASGIGLTLTLCIYSLMGSFGGPFETSHSPVADPLTLNTLKAGVVDAGTIYAGYLSNPDGGDVSVSGGLAVESMMPVRFNGPGGSAEIHFTGGALALNAGGGQKVGIVGGGLSQEEFTAGQQALNSLQINGGASMASISVVAGPGGPAADAGVDITPVGNGVCRVWGEGLRVATIQNADGGGALNLRGDVQIDDRRPLVSVDAGTARQAFAVGCSTVSGGNVAANFTTPFDVTPVCVCQARDAESTHFCSATTTAISIEATVDGVYCWACFEAR